MFNGVCTVVLVFLAPRAGVTGDVEITTGRWIGVDLAGRTD